VDEGGSGKGQDYMAARPVPANNAIGIVKTTGDLVGDGSIASLACEIAKRPRLSLVSPKTGGRGGGASF